MSDEMTDTNPLDPCNVLKVNARPLQLPGRDKLLRTSVVGGPETGGDRRMFLSVKLLTELLECARESPVMRAQVNYTGVRVDLYQRPDGHQYEVWTLIGSAPKPERMPGVVDSMIHGGAGVRVG